MLGGLFKHGWQSTSVETRLSSIEKMDAQDSANQKIFEQLANADTQNSVREAAMLKLTDPGLVFKISQTHTERDTKTIAKQAFAKLIGVNSEISESNLRVLLNDQPESSVAITKHCQHSALRSELALAMSEADQAAIIADVDYTDTRGLIAQQLSSIEQLELARKQLKGKDKNAEKIVKEKIDAIHTQQKLDEANAAIALELCEKMEYIANHEEWRTEFKGQFSVWSQRWSEIDFKPAPEIAQRYTQAFDKVSATVQLKIAIETAEQAQQKLANDFTGYCQQLSALSLEQLNEQSEGFSAKLKLGLGEWDKLSKIITASTQSSKTFSQSQTAIETALAFSQSVADNSDDCDVIKKAISSLSWSANLPALASKVDAQSKLDELQSQLADAKKADKDKLDKLHKRMNRLLGVTKQGNLAQARRELAAVTKAIEHYSGKDRTILNERLEQAGEVVTKMVDWNNFVTEPKYLELCDAMEALANSTTDAKPGSKPNPDKLAKKIHALQEQWKGIGYSDCSETHWERFKTAADTAYQPCAEFFKQRLAIRRENLAKREPLLVKMSELLENTPWDESPDYKAVEVGIRQIMQDWQKIKDVEQGPGQKQWKKLTKLKSAVNEKLDVVYDANIELKNQIIAQTSALLELDVNDQTLPKLQLFQSRWKQVGVTRRKQDQAAWKRFKGSSDDVYAKIQGLRKDQRAEEDEQINGYRAVISKIQDLAKTATELSVADKQLEQLESDYGALPALPQNLPENLLKKLDMDYRRAGESYSKARNRILEAGRNKIMESLAQKAELCAQLEQLGDSGSDDDVTRLQNALSEIDIDDKALNKSIQKRIDQALKSDRQKAGEDRKKICIDLEVLLGIDSPTEDKALRMTMQLERLKNKGIGQSQSLNDATIKQLTIDWLCLPGAVADVQKKLDQRFSELIKSRR